MNALGVFVASILLSAYAAQSIGAEPTAVRRTLKTDDFFRVQDLSDPQVSPDGLWVAYVVTSSDRDADEARSAIWMVSWDGSQRLALTSAADGTGKPKWSPDGRYLAFVAKPAGSDRGQIMLLDRRGGDARQLTSVTGEIGEYAWSPDGKRLAIAMEQGDEEKLPKPIVIDARQFKQDEDGYLRAGHGRHLYLFDIESKRIDALTTDPEFNEDLPAWSPDGRQIAFIRTNEKGPDQDGRTDIDVIDARPGATARNVVRPYAPNTQTLAWSPDGTLIAYLQGLEPKFNAYIQDRLFVVPAAGDVPRSLTDKLDRAVMSYAFTGDAAAMAIAVEDDGTIYPARVDLASGAITRQVPAGRFVVSALTSEAIRRCCSRTTTRLPKCTRSRAGSCASSPRTMTHFCRSLYSAPSRTFDSRARTAPRSMGSSSNRLSLYRGESIRRFCGSMAAPMGKMNTPWLWMAINSSRRCLRPRVSSCCA
jgi:hypothetical protein